MRLLGIDTGSKHIGFARFNSHLNNITYHKEVNPTSLSDLMLQLEDPHFSIKIDSVIFEKPFFTGATLPRSYGVIESIGVMKYFFEKQGIPYYEFSPKSAKKWFTGSGKATKEDIIARVKADYNIDVKSTHINDAVAIAVGWYNKSQNDDPS